MTRPPCPHCDQRHPTGKAFMDCDSLERSFCSCDDPQPRSIFYGQAVECGRCRLGIPGVPVS